MQTTLNQKCAQLENPTGTESTSVSNSNDEGFPHFGKEHLETWKYVDWFLRTKGKCFVGDAKISEKIESEGVKISEGLVDRTLKDLESAQLLQISFDGNKRHILRGPRMDFPSITSNTTTSKDKSKKVERDSLSALTDSSGGAKKSERSASGEVEASSHQPDKNVKVPAPEDESVLGQFIKRVSEEHQITLKLSNDNHLNDDDLVQLEKDLVEKIAPKEIRPCAVTLDKWAFPTSIAPISSSSPSCETGLAKLWWEKFNETNFYPLDPARSGEFQGSVQFFQKLLEVHEPDRLANFIKFTFDGSWMTRGMSDFSSFEGKAKSIWDEFLVDAKKSGVVKDTPLKVDFPSHIRHDVNVGFDQAEQDYAILSFRMAKERAVGLQQREVTLPSELVNDLDKSVFVLNDPAENFDMLTASTPRWVAASILTGRFGGIDEIPDGLSYHMHNGYLGRRVPFKDAVRRELELLTSSDISEFLRIVEEQFSSQLQAVKLVRSHEGKVIDSDSAVSSQELAPKSPLAKWEAETYEALRPAIVAQRAVEEIRETQLMAEYSQKEQEDLINSDNQSDLLRALEWTTKELSDAFSGKKIERLRKLPLVETAMARLPKVLEIFLEVLNLLEHSKSDGYKLFSPKWSLVHLFFFLAQQDDIPAKKIAAVISEVGVEKAWLHIGKLAHSA
ncbi:hypothetical protein VSU19_19895 [Verrucomicrobiales bacterium BCK34]|nr:hypothetical protein [Verrucomicrobiales bacterium BCK34]